MCRVLADDSLVNGKLDPRVGKCGACVSTFALTCCLLDRKPPVINTILLERSNVERAKVLQSLRTKRLIKMDGKKEGRFEKDVSLIVKLLRGPRRRSKTKDKEPKQTSPPDNQDDLDSNSQEDDSNDTSVDNAEVRPSSPSGNSTPERKYGDTPKSILQKDGLPKTGLMKSSPRSSPRASPRSSRSPAVARGRIPVPTNSPVRSPAAMRARSLYASPSRSPGPYRGM